MTPQQTLKQTTDMADSMRRLTQRAAFVGLPNEKVGGAVYGGGATVILVGSVHEYGAPDQGIPQRSFLRAPFRINRESLNASIANQFKLVTTGQKSVESGLNAVGAIATNVSKAAFKNQGYGTWPDITQATKDRKGSSRVLIDNRILSGSISWAVR